MPARAKGIALSEDASDLLELDSPLDLWAPFGRDGLAVAALAAHAAIAAYVALGWLATSRVALFVYLLLLPLILLQWLVNGGASIVNNLETWARTGHWRDPRNLDEGRFFQRALARAGIDLSAAQIAVLTVVIMMLLWQQAFFAMVLIVPE